MYMAAHGHHSRRRQPTPARGDLERLEDKYIESLNTLIIQFARDWADKQNKFSRELRGQRAYHHVERSGLSEEHYQRRLARRMDQERELRGIPFHPGRWRHRPRDYEDEVRSRHLDERDSQLLRHWREKLNMEMRHREDIKAMMLRHQSQESAMLLEHQHRCQDLRENVFEERNTASLSWLRS